MSIELKDTKFVYTGHHEEKILLDCSDFLLNKSRIPLQAEGLNILDFLVGSAEKERLNGSDLVVPALLIDILITSHLIQAARPFHILEYGCLDGQLSFHLAEVIGLFNSKSSLSCLSGGLDSKWIKWKERIAAVENPPQISFLVGDYNSIPLQQNFFDIILIHNEVKYKDPCQLILRTTQLMTEDGIIICYCDQSSLLEISLKLFFDKTEEYEVTSSKKVILAKSVDQCWGKDEQNFREQLRQHLSQADALLKNKLVKKDGLMDMIDILQQDAKTASLLDLADLKIYLLAQKQQLIEFLLNL